jgi:hypothetical protein
MIDDIRLHRSRAGKMSTLIPAALAELATELLSLGQENAGLKQLLARVVKLPYASTSSVCKSKQVTPRRFFNRRG